MPVSALMNWSGGKDSALALYHALRDPSYQVTHLLTSINAHYQRVSMHGVRVALLEAQAQRIGLPLVPLALPESPSMEEYERLMHDALAPLQVQGVSQAIFGDIYLEDLRAYREQQLARVGLGGIFPLWQCPTADLLREYIDLGFQAVVVCVNEQHLDASFCGRLLDADFLRDLPPALTLAARMASTTASYSTPRISAARSRLCAASWCAAPIRPLRPAHLKPAFGTAICCQPRSSSLWCGQVGVKNDFISIT
ncbi:hypothetical protein [Hymenobacter sp. HDW8]|uniref:Dph6-related ATP pyrophosphatase n=1 Tax=Hymenobacter sp. HDW8 TaxID=2714932 RepID=UPI00293BD1C6|nr:hypothetical protein [Hymenobacter sp. HDW8]